MSRLINFGAGEIADRLTILGLKVLVGEEAGKEVKHFRDERNVLLTHFQAKGLTGRVLQEILELAGVNSLLWHAEDDLRAWRTTNYEQGPIEEIVKLAFRIQSLNDRRSQLVEAINKEVGEHLGEEKV